MKLSYHSRRYQIGDKDRDKDMDRDRDDIDWSKFRYMIFDAPKQEEATPIDTHT